MAAREALAVVLDVGENMQMQANVQGDTYLSLAIEAISWIYNRKVFSESKDEILLILYGCNETRNDLNDDEPSQYEGIVLKYELQLPTVDAIKFLQTEIVPTDKQGDFLSALIVATDGLLKGSAGKRGIACKQIVLFSNLGAPFRDNDKETTALLNGFEANEIELNIIGPQLRETSESQQNSQGEDGDSSVAGPSNSSEKLQKTAQMLVGERMAKKMLQKIDGECYSLQEALPMLSFFQRREVRPTPWKCDLKIGNEVTIPVQMYVKTKENKPKQTWQKMDAADPNAPVKKEQIYERIATAPADAANATANGQSLTNNNDQSNRDEPPRKQFFMQNDKVEKEDLIKSYKFGRTIVPFNAADVENSKFESGGKCLELIGQTKRDNVHRKYFCGDGSKIVTADKDDPECCTALSAFVRALKENDTVAIVRYAYSRATNPRCAAMFPVEAGNGVDCDHLVYVPLPYSDDIRQFTFPEFTEKTKPTEDQNALMDDLIYSMDLTDAKIDADGSRSEAFDMESVMNPATQYLFQCLQQRALYPDQPLPRADPRFVDPLEPPNEKLNLAKPVLQDMKQKFKLEVIEEKKEKKTAAEIFNREGDVIAPCHSTSMLSVTSEASVMANTVVGTINPVQDFNSIIIANPDMFTYASQQLCRIIEKLVLNTLGTQMYSKARECCKCFRDSCIQYAKPKIYNDFIVAFKDDLVRNSKLDFWQAIAKDKLALISKSECSDSEFSAQDVSAFLSQNEPSQISKVDVPSNDEPDLLDELE